MGVAKFCVGAFLLVVVFRKTTGVHENSLLLSKVVPPVPNVVHPAPHVPGTPNKNIQINIVHPLHVHSQNQPNPQNPQQQSDPSLVVFNPQSPLSDSLQPPVISPLPIHRPVIPPINPHNPFLNSQQPSVGVTQPSLAHVQQPVIPPINPHNPFLNSQQPAVGVTQPSLTPVQQPVIPPINPHNPFLNSQQPSVGVTQPSLTPVQQPVIPPINPHNPFLNSQQPAVGVTQPSLTPVQQPVIPPINPHNPFLNSQQPSVGVTQPSLAPVQQPVIPPINPHNPFLNTQQPSVGVTQPSLAPVQRPGIPPINPHNPFLNPQQPLTGVTQTFLPHVQPSSVPPVQRPGVPPINPQNPFLNPQQAAVGITQPSLPSVQKPVVPQINPQNPFLNPYQPPAGITKPVQPVPTIFVTQPPPSSDLRRRCLQARGQFSSFKCNKFVNCWDDLAVEQFCPVGLAFNPAGYCDHSYNVDCEGRPYEAIPVVPSTPDIIAPPERLPTISPDNIMTLHTQKPLVADVGATTPMPPSYLPPGSVPVDLNLKKKCLGPRGLFASDYCNKYVNCWDGNVVEQDCPPGLLFSAKGYCDFAHNVNCYNRILIASTVPQPPASSAPPTNLPPDSLKPKPPQTGIVPTRPSPPPFNGLTQEHAPTYVPPGNLTDQRLRRKCLGERGLYPSDYCHKFVICWDRFAVEQECPAGLLFSDKGYCDYAYNVNCYNRTAVPIPIPQPPASAAPPTNSPPDNLKPKPPQPDATTYRPPVDDFLTLPTQTKKPSPPETTAPPPYVPAGVVPSDKLKKKCLKLRGQFPSDICNRYVNCWDGYAVEQDCPPGLLFSEKGYCDYAYNVICNSRTIITAPLSQPVLPPSNGEPNKPITVPPHQPLQEVITQVPPYRPDVTHQPALPPVEPAVQPVDPAVRRKCLGLRGQFPSESCHKYIDCWDNVAVEHNCPPGLLFSEKGYCDFAYNVNCNNRTVVKTAPSSSCPAPHGTFRDRSNCSRYFTCIDNTISVKYECPSGLHFNDVIGVCDYSYRVDCNREPFVYQPLNKNIKFLQKVPAALMDATIDCRPGRVLRLNPECTSAALCRNTVTEIVHCPVGLAYDATSDRCLPPQLAQCQDF